MFDRQIPKFAEILLFPDLEPEKRRDALITLNELVSHQETMDEMISYGIVQPTSALLFDDNDEVREQAAKLMGSFVTSMQARADILPACEGL